MAFRLGIDPPMIKGLSINGFFSYDLYNRYQKIFRKPWTLYFPNWDSAERDANGFITSMEVVPTLRGYSAPELQENHDRYRSEEHTSELQSLMRISYAVFCLKKKKITTTNRTINFHNKH